MIKTTRWAIIKAGDLVMLDGIRAEVASISDPLDEFGYSGAPWRTVTLIDGRTMDIRGSWKVERVSTIASATYKKQSR